MQKSVVRIGKMVIGEGRPKIAVPLAAATAADLHGQISALDGLPFDLIEFRADFLQDAGDKMRVLAHLKEVRSALPETPLLFTFRRHEEGGMFPCGDEYYFTLLHEALASGLADMVDIESFAPEQGVGRAVEAAKAKGTAVLMCNHHFTQTPPLAEIVSRLEKMEKQGADICKIAVMPRTPEDVLTLLQATLQANGKISRPIVTMSMGRLGAVSRLCGQLVGSSVTFGAAMQASAPGQIDAAFLNRILKLLEL